MLSTARLMKAGLLQVAMIVVIFGKIAIAPKIFCYIFVGHYSTIDFILKVSSLLPKRSYFEKENNYNRFAGPKPVIWSALSHGYIASQGL